TRSVLRPVRTRRIGHRRTRSRNEPATKTLMVTPTTRKTLATIGALWVSFAVTASANHVPATPPAVPLAAVQEKGRPVEPAPSGTPAASGPSGMAANGASGAFEILKAQSNAPAKSVIPFDARRPGVASPNAGAQGVVFLPVSTPADRAQPRP